MQLCIYFKDVQYDFSSALVQREQHKCENHDDQRPQERVFRKGPAGLVLRKTREGMRQIVG